LVRSTSNAFERLLCEIGRPELLRRHGHYQVWFGPDAAKRAERESHEMEQLRIPTQPVAAEILHAIAIAAGVPSAAALWFPEGGHIVDPLEVTRALMRAAVARGARFELDEVRALRPVGDLIEVALGSGRQLFSTAVVCAGAWSRPLLAAFGVHAPLEAAYGYHVELADQQPQVDAPLVYMDQKILVTPMSGRLRASGYMEFAGLDSEADPRKPARLRQKLRSLGYACAADGPSWRGPRPVLPDYLPGIGRAPGPHRLFYAVGHQHLGLTLAPVTAELMADMIAGRKPAMDVAEFDLKRFGVNPGSH
jgi:D-amino-acid dehydrogenase